MTNSRKSLRLIVLAVQPLVLRQMLRRALDGCSSLSVIAELDDLQPLSRILYTANPDWIIASLDSQERVPQPIRALLPQHPSTAVVGIARDGSRLRIGMNTEGESDLNYTLQQISLTTFTLILRYKLIGMLNGRWGNAEYTRLSRNGTQPVKISATFSTNGTSNRDALS